MDFIRPLRHMAAALLTPQCIQCHQPAQPPNYQWCNNCWQHVANSHKCCPCCGLPSEATDRACGRCQQAPPFFSRLYCIGDYRPPLSTLITRFKYGAEPLTGDALSNRLYDVLPPSPNVEAMLPVPMAARKRAQRGMNQAYWLAKRLSHYNKLPVLHDVIRHAPQQEHQAGLTRKQRLRLAAHTYQLHRAPSFQRIAMVDDVVTTMATVNTLGKLLYQCGVSYLEVWCLARTPET